MTSPNPSGVTVVPPGYTDPHTYTLGAFNLKAATAAAGFAKQNGTPTLISWPVPADGANHRALIVLAEVVTSNETGGLIQVNWTTPDGTAGNYAAIAGGKTAGIYNGSFAGSVIAAPGTLITVAQASALTLGAATVWAEIWGS